MSKTSVAVIGGGAAGFFSAINCAITHPHCAVTIFEKSREKHFSFKIENEPLICFKVYQNEIPVFKFGVKSNKRGTLAISFPS